MKERPKPNIWQKIRLFIEKLGIYLLIPTATWFWGLGIAFIETALYVYYFLFLLSIFGIAYFIILLGKKTDTWYEVNNETKVIFRRKGK
jgi:hypothetical protein